MGNRKFYKMEEIEALSVEEVHRLYKEYINLIKPKFFQHFRSVMKSLVKQRSLYVYIKW